MVVSKVAQLAAKMDLYWVMNWVRSLADSKEVWMVSLLA
jgi:hypothetical protein